MDLVSAPGAEGVTTPETLRQKDRKGDETLESSPDGLAEGARSERFTRYG